MTKKRIVEPVFNEWGWESHEKVQRRRYARMPLTAKIAWLEEAHRMVLLMEEQRSTVHDRVSEYDSED